jgi:hypothetical protein
VVEGVEILIQPLGEGWLLVQHGGICVGFCGGVSEQYTRVSLLRRLTLELLLQTVAKESDFVQTMYLCTAYLSSPHTMVGSLYSGSMMVSAVCVSLGFVELNA